MPNVICRVGLGKTPVIRGDGTSTRDYIHVSEIVDGYLNAAERQWGIPVCETYNLGSFRSYSTQEVVDTILAVMGRIDIIPKHEKELQGELKHQHISDPTSDRIGWKPQIDLETGLKLTVPYYLEYLKEKSSV
jgi:UDP-glucose 4-epimerase